MAVSVSGYQTGANGGGSHPKTKQKKSRI